MLGSIKAFFDKHLAPSQSPDASGSVSDHAPEQHRLALAACALLLELAHADDEFTDDEREHIQDAMVRHFALPQDQVDHLIELAEQARQRSSDLYQFTSLITRSYTEGQRMVLAEVMWRLVYADGELAKRESYLMQKLSHLLELRPGYLAEAKKRALPEAD
jgi:uncharacterized tellurite resistance protein B-like protein